MRSYNYLLCLLVAVLSASTLLTSFPTGKERSYTLKNVVNLGDHKNGTQIAYQVTGVVRVGSVWGTDELKLLKFHLENPRLHVLPQNGPSGSFDTFVPQQSYLETAVNREFYAIWHLGFIKKVYVHAKEDPSFINLKKAIVSVFQYQLTNGEFDETDVSGNCQVAYALKSKSTYEKIWRKCKSDDLEFHRRADRALGAEVESMRVSTFKVTTDGILVEMESGETHNFVVVANKNAGGYAKSSLSLKFDGSISNIAAIQAGTPEEAIKTVKGLKKHSLLTDVLVPFRSRNNLTFKEAIKTLKGDLTADTIGTQKAALALIKTVLAAKHTTKAEFLKVLNAHTLQEIKGQLTDILAAIQSVHSHEAAHEVLHFQKSVDADLVERYLQGLAVGTRPQLWVIQDLLRLSELSFEEPKVYDTLVQTISAMAYRFARLPRESYKSKMVTQVENFISTHLAECNDSQCTTLYLRGLHNLQSVDALPILFEHLNSKDRQIAVAAMKALRNYPVGTWTESAVRQFEDIFFQRLKLYDSSVRTLSLDVLLEQQLSDVQLTRLVMYLKSNDKEYEVKKYLLEKLQVIAADCTSFRARFEGILFRDVSLNNYHVFAQKGISTAMFRSFSKAPSFNASILSVQEIQRGVLKRGLVDMTINADNDQFSVFTLGLYAGGLSSYVSSADSDVDSQVPEEDPNAGMEVSVQNAYFRPMQFFGSQGELMGHAWSGTASEPTAAYTATTLLHDHHEVIRLQNGAGLAVTLVGAVSIDLNGQVQFSLWNRNAHCQVDKNSGLALFGSLGLETSFINLISEFVITQEPRLSVNSDIDFSGDVQLCIQLSQPETVLRHSIEKITKVHGTKVDRRHVCVHSFHIGGFTHALNQKNNEMCNVVLGT